MEFGFSDREIDDVDIEGVNHDLPRRQKVFRLAAGFIADEYRQFDWVTKIAIFGSVAKPLWKEVPRFRDFKRKGIALWHECSDLDLAVWVSRTDMLNNLRKARTTALKKMHEKYPHIMGVAHHQAEVFVLEASTSVHLGRLCTFGQCPKPKKRECKVADCGKPSFLKIMEGFRFHQDALEGIIMLYPKDDDYNE